MIDIDHPDYDNTPASAKRPSFDYTPRDPGAPMVSIITPYYNIGEVFWETVCCVQRLSYQHFEWIIVNDGSTDPDSLAQLDRAATADTRVRIINQANKGPSAARNAAVRAAQGRYLFLLDADDLVEPTFVEKALWVMETQPQFSACSAYTVTFGVRSLLWNHGFQAYEANLTEENFIPNLAMIRRDAYLQAGGYDESIIQGHEDWDLWLNLAEAGGWGYTIPEYLTWYRSRHHSRISETSGNQQTSRAFHTWLEQKHKSLRSHFPHPTFITGMDHPHAVLQHDSPISNPVAKRVGIKRILFLVPWLHIGGADKFNLDLVRTLSRHGYEFTMVTTVPSDHPWLHEFSKVTPDIFHLPSFLQYADYPRFLDYVITSRQIDAIIISNSELGYYLVPFLRNLHPNLAILDYTHMEEEGWNNGGYPWMSVRLDSQLDLRVTCNQHLKNWMVGRGADPESIAVVHANIDSNEWDPAHYDRAATRRQLGIADDTSIILFVGRIVDQKRPLMWAEILRRLDSTESNFIGLVIGNGDMLPAMKSYVARHQLRRRIRFLGELPNEKVREIMAAADILLLPSKYEGLALVLYEAMAMNMVPVATACGGHPELVTEECGYLISLSADEDDRYAEAVGRLLRDRELRDSMGAAGRERVKESFTLDDMAVGMENAIGRALEIAADRLPSKDIPLAYHNASLAMEYTRLSQLSDRLWYELYIKKGGVPRIRSAADLARLVRIVLFPIGTRRYEVYKSTRRALLPAQ